MSVEELWRTPEQLKNGLSLDQGYSKAAVSSLRLEVMETVPTSGEMGVGVAEALGLEPQTVTESAMA
jgi:hypothetical protein